MASFNDMTAPIKRLVRLYSDSARLAAVEKLTRFLSGVTIALICTLFVIICLAFVSFGAVIQLRAVVSPVAAYMIVGGFYLLLIVCLIVFKRTLLLNPIARFLSKIILDAPTDNCTCTKTKESEESEAPEESEENDKSDESE